MTQHSESMLADQTADLAQIHQILGSAAADLVRICPESAERIRAIKHLEEAGLCAERAILGPLPTAQSWVDRELSR